MFRNHLQTAWRGLIKNPLYSVINIGGLGLALCACMLILLYVLHEYSFDRFEKEGNRIFAIYANPTDGSHSREGLSFAAGPLLQAADPDVESVTRLVIRPSIFIVSDKAHPERVFTPDNPLFADANFFSQFSLPLLKGGASARPFTVVLSRTMAKKYFGTQDPIGRMLVFDKKYNFEVTGVAEDPPSNAYLDFDAVFSLSSYPQMTEHQWWISQDINFTTGNFKTYVRLRNPGSVSKVEQVMSKVAAFTKPSEFLSFSKNESNVYSLSPLRQEHMQGFIGRKANRPYLKIFSLVAALVLLLALINYMSLATARASIRAREVGVRKTLGAGKKILLTQFYVESAVCTGIAFILGLGMYVLLRPAFVELLHVQIDPGFGYSSIVILSFGSLLSGTILVAGSYPALVLSALRPAVTPKGAGVRRVLTVLQFSIATGLIISLTVMKQQLYYFMHTDIGMDRDHVVMVPYDQEVAKHAQAFKAEVAGLPGVQGVTQTWYQLFAGGVSVQLTEGRFKGRGMSIGLMEADTNIFSVMQMRWKYPPLPGAWTSTKLPIVINESAIPFLGLPDDPRGAKVSWGHNPEVVIGVVRNFVYESLARNIEPIVIEPSGLIDYAGGACLLIRAAPGVYLPNLLDNLKKTYSRYPSVQPFSYSFADEQFDKLYQSEDRMARLMGIFTLLAVMVACMGLFGLATFSTLSRTKEIGIRKVLGAEVSGLVALMVRDFLLLVALSVLVAWPVAWWVMHDWLQQYAYRISVSPWVLLGAGLGIALLSLLTVGSLALKAARANPADSLRQQ